MSVGFFTGRKIETGFIPRASHEPGGFGFLLRKGSGMEPLVIPREVAGWRTFVGHHAEPVLWSELMDKRREEQREHLERLLQEEEPRWVPAQVWVFFNRGWLYGGWHCYIRTARDLKRSGGFKGGVSEDTKLASHLMWTIQVGVLPLSGWKTWSEWMEAVAVRWPKKKTKEDRRLAGIVTGWWDNERRLWFWEKGAEDGDRPGEVAGVVNMGGMS
jgi:hypothetical protein